MGRQRHNWDPGLSERQADGTWSSRCSNCGMIERTGWYEHGGRVREVLQWSTPAGVLLRIRPVTALDAPRSAPPLTTAFAGVTIGGMPECPKQPDAWPAR